MDYEEPIWYFVSIEKHDGGDEDTVLQVSLPEASALRTVQAALRGDDFHKLHIWMHRCKPEEGDDE